MRATLLAVVVTLAIGGCNDSGDDAEPPDPYAAVAHAAQATVAKSPVRLGLRVLTTGAEHRDYEARGAIELKHHRYVAKIDDTHPPGLDVFFPGPIFGHESSTYTKTEQFEGVCGIDPHRPLGSIPGLLSLEESMELVWSVTRALRDPLTADQNFARLVPDQPSPEGAGAYRARVDRHRVRAGLPDEARWMVSELWPSLSQPIFVSVDKAGLLSGVEMVFNHAPTGPGRKPSQGLVVLQATFHQFRGPLPQPHLGCIAME